MRVKSQGGDGLVVTGQTLAHRAPTALVGSDVPKYSLTRHVIAA
jgi:hypothetical protein